MNMNPICIMLVDDNLDDNFFHERAIRQNNPANVVIAKTSALEALDCLKSTDPADMHPDLIFLDINMPAMNGWEFLEAYNLLDKSLKSRAIVVMLTTSANPDDVAKAKTWSCVSEYRTKPLTQFVVKDLIERYFSGPGVRADDVRGR